MEALQDISPHLKLRVSKRARKIALRLDPAEREMHLVVPLNVKLKKAYSFARTHENWIRQKLAALPDAIPFQHGSIIPIFGEEMHLSLTYDKTLKKTDINLKKNELIVSTNKDDPSGRIARFLKERARIAIADLACEKAESIQKEIMSIQIRDTKSRWGSCSPDGRLSFCWRLIFAPWESLDYVVAHEVAHLVHMNHGKDFWALCEELSENYSLGKKWMRTHGHTLMRYGLPE